MADESLDGQTLCQMKTFTSLEMEYYKSGSDDFVGHKLE